MKQGWLRLLVLILAGETVFLLPFVVPRVFRPSLLDVLQISNLQLGTAFSAYGAVAMVSYLVGGPIADRFAPRSLISLALLSTAAGGLVMAAVPDPATITALYAFWGMTTILLFWAPLLRATRQWGGDQSLGTAFGVLDGGRGLLAAVVGSAMVVIFAALLPADASLARNAQRSDAFRVILLLCTGFTATVGILAWYALPATRLRSDPRAGIDRGAVMALLRRRALWLQAVVILCAYLAYKSTDYFSLMARDGFGYDEVAAAQLGAVSFWMRPIAAVCAGLLADRIDATRVLMMGFGLIALGCLGLATAALPLEVPQVLLATVLTTSVAIYAVRGVYYAVMGEAKIPVAVTGTAVGLVSVIGFTPDLFAGPLFGYLLDQSPGIAGHQQIFAIVAGTAMVGLIAALILRRRR